MFELPAKRGSKALIAAAICGAQSGNSLRIEIALEIRGDRRQCRRRGDRGKKFCRPKNFIHLLKIIRVIRPQKNRAAGRERRLSQRGKMFADEPVPPVFEFWPRIRKINMHRRRRVPWQEVLQKITGFNAQAARVLQSQPATFFIQLLKSAEQPLDAEEIFLRIGPGIFRQKRSIPAAEFHFERLGNGKKRGQIQRRQNGGELDE